ncbi:MAG: VOC family protein [Oscillatoria sp. Prado101]|nr:VOC family protein [Oscillatoria sp. Prado101]
MAYAGNVQIELTQHLSGESIFKEFLERKGEGMHHLGFIVDDYEKAVGDLAKNGYPIIQSGRAGNNPGVRFAFFDTEAAIGATVEILVLDDDMRNLFDRIKRGDF